MEFHARDKEKGPVVALVLALIVLGLGSLLMTWKSIARQRQIVDDHMVLTSSSILRGVESNLMRLVRTLHNNPTAKPLFPGLTTELFKELATSDDIVFVTLYDAQGDPIIASEELATIPKLSLPETVAKDIDFGQIWHFEYVVNNRFVLVSGTKVRPSLARFTGPDAANPPAPGQGMNHMSPGHMDGEMDMGPGMGMGQGMMGNGKPAPTVYLVIGLNAEKHMSQFRQYRRAAMLQTGYVFLAAVVLWSLAFAYLRRRGHSRKLVRLESFQNKLLDNMPDGLVTLSRESEIMAANNSAKRLLSPKGAEETPEIIGRSWNDFPFGGYWGSSRTAPFQWTQHDYEGRQLELLALPFQEKDEAAAPELGQRLVLIRDRTQIRSLEEDLNEAKRLAAIGSLAAGVAHEVRNPLSSLRGFAQLFANKLKGQAPLDEYAKAMVQEADRLNRVVTDLLYLARPHGISPQPTSLEELAESLKRLMHFDFENRHVEPEVAFETDTVCADQDALRQVLLNLISNALDALVQGGLDDAAKGMIRISSARADGGVWITVADNGPGMDETIRAEAFKPFVTGKKTGTGLGLAIVQNIMRAHKGKVLIESEPGQGTAVRLFFPDQCSEVNDDE